MISTFVLLVLMILTPLLTIVNCSFFLISYNDKENSKYPLRDQHKMGVVVFTLAMAIISFFISIYFIICIFILKKKIEYVLYGLVFLFYFITALFSFISSALYQTDYANHYRFNLGLTIFMYLLCILGVAFVVLSLNLGYFDTLG
jgi:hypothetical protein